MIVEFDLEPAEVETLLDALIDYRERTDLARAARHIVHAGDHGAARRCADQLAREAAQTTCKVIDQLRAAIDAVPAAAVAYDVVVPAGFTPEGWQLP